MRLRASLLSLAVLVLPARAQEPALNDYPTGARADYVLGCMAAIGQTREALERCSCSIDVIASNLPYARYVEAETILSMRQTTGQVASMFRNNPHVQEIVADLRRAQAEAEVQCFP